MTSNNLSFSILMSVYHKDDSNQLNEAITSLFHQNAQANELIIVKDGKLNNHLEELLNLWSNKESRIKIVGYDKNRGLGEALNYGLKYCSNELVARMDSDDISIKDRFESQLNLFNKNPNLILCGGQIREFGNGISRLRTVPLTKSKILKRLKWSNPINHVSVMFKKSEIEKVGGYKHFPDFEDFYLWARLLTDDKEFCNIDKVLVDVRVNDLSSRRKGIKYLSNEVKFYYCLYKLNQSNLHHFIIRAFMSIPIRLSPSFIVKCLYSLKSKLFNRI